MRMKIESVWLFSNSEMFRITCNGVRVLKNFNFLKISIKFEPWDFCSCKKKKKEKAMFDYAILRSIFYISRQKRNIIYRINARRAVNILSRFQFAIVVGRNQPPDNFYSKRHYN